MGTACASAANDLKSACQRFVAGALDSENADAPPRESGIIGARGSLEGHCRARNIWLLPFLHYLVAWAIAYVCGIGLSYFLMTGFVFRAERRLSTAVRFPLIYVLQYLMGSAIIYVLVEHVGVRPFLAALVAMVCVVPTTFLLARALFRQSPH